MQLRLPSAASVDGGSTPPTTSGPQRSADVGDITGYRVRVLVARPATSIETPVAAVDGVAGDETLLPITVTPSPAPVRQPTCNVLAEPIPPTHDEALAILQQGGPRPSAAPLDILNAFISPEGRPVPEDMWQQLRTTDPEAFYRAMLARSWCSTGTRQTAEALQECFRQKIGSQESADISELDAPRPRQRDVINLAYVKFEEIFGMYADPRTASPPYAIANTRLYAHGGITAESNTDAHARFCLLPNFNYLRESARQQSHDPATLASLLKQLDDGEASFPVALHELLHGRWHPNWTKVIYAFPPALTRAFGETTVTEAEVHAVNGSQNYYNAVGFPEFPKPDGLTYHNATELGLILKTSLAPDDPVNAGFDLLMRAQLAGEPDVMAQFVEAAYDVATSLGVPVDRKKVGRALESLSPQPAAGHDLSQAALYVAAGIVAFFYGSKLMASLNRPAPVANRA